MVRHKQPPLLQTLSLSQLSHFILTLCEKYTNIINENNYRIITSKASKKLRPYFLYKLPGPIRNRVLDSVINKVACRRQVFGSDVNMGKTFLLFLKFLLSPEIKHLRIILCCYYGCSDQKRILQLLVKHGSGLESLKLERSSLMRMDKDLLRHALTTMTNLLHLAIRNICTDNTLRTIGMSCPSLLHLDISNCKQVTDKGLRDLCIRVEYKDRDSNDPGPGESTSTVQQRPCCFPWCQSSNLQTNLQQESDLETVFLQKIEISNACCHKLEILNIADTSVTAQGVIVALKNITNLRTLGEYKLTGRALEILSNSSGGKVKPSKLQSIHSCRTTTSSIEIVSRICPCLETLCIMEPCMILTSLSLLEKLNKLLLWFLEPDPTTIRDLYVYLRKNGNVLKKLDVTFVYQGENPEIDISVVAQYCSILKTLRWCGCTLMCQNSFLISQRSVNLRNLAVVHLGKDVQNDVVSLLLTCVPTLEVAHFHMCPDLSTDVLEEVLIAKKTQHLKCFYIYEAPQLTTAAVFLLISKCIQLNRAGNLTKWAIDCDGMKTIHQNVRHNNLDFEILSGSHWYNSSCIG